VKKIGLILAVAMTALGLMASSAFAVTKSQAGEISNHYAEVTWHVGDVEHCEASGKNEVGKAQYYCYGYFDMWKVNVGPNGEITFAGLS
jgi:hypothetical protein